MEQSSAQPEGEVSIFSSGKLYEVDMVTDELTRRGIPFFRRQRSFAGLEFAMPATAAQGPGVYFTVIVPSGAAVEARQIVEDLDFSAEEVPGFWSYGPKPRWKRMYQVYAVVTLLLMAGIAAWQIIGYLKYFTDVR